MKKRILIWISGTDLITNANIKKEFIGGMQVQMYMWAKTFVNKGWDVMAFTDIRYNHKKKIDGITYIFYPRVPLLGPVISVFFTLLCLLFIQPSVIIINGATRDLYFVAIFSKLTCSKVIEVFASDSDLESGEELIKRKFDRLLYRRGVRKTQNFIVQNVRQSELLQNTYRKKNYLIVPSIWANESRESKKIRNEHRDLIFWVANFRLLKRPEWFIEIAKQNQDKKFLMVGNPIDKLLYEKCSQMIMELSNIDLIPGLSFSKTSKLFERARLFICTSEIEGFPNTFLQAWMNGCPVLSSFDPSDLIKIHNLGLYCSTLEDFLDGINRFDDPDYYLTVSENSISYFHNHLSADTHFDKIIKHFRLS